MDDSERSPVSREGFPAIRMKIWLLMGVSKGGPTPFGRSLGNPQKNTLGRVGGTRAPRLSSLRELEATGVDDSERSPVSREGFPAIRMKIWLLMGVSKGGPTPFGRSLGNPQKNTLGRAGGTRALRLSHLRVLEATGMDDCESSPVRRAESKNLARGRRRVTCRGLSGDTRRQRG